MEKGRFGSEILNDEGIALLQEGRLEHALAKLEESIRADPEFPVPWGNKGAVLFLIGESKKKQGKLGEARKRYEEGIAACKKALLADPGFASAWNYLGACFYKLYVIDRKIPHLKFALMAFDKAVLFDKKLAEAWANKAEALLKLGELAEGDEKLGNPLELYKSAEYACSSAAIIEPNNHAAFFLRGCALYRQYLLNGSQDLLRLAIVDFERAIELNKRYFDAWIDKAGAVLTLGELNEAEGNKDEAKKDYEEALHTADTAIFLNKKSAIGWFYRGVSLYRLKNFGEATKDLYKAIKLNARFSGAMIWCAEALMGIGEKKAKEKGRYDARRYIEAIALLRRALKLDPYNAEAQSRIGSAYYVMGDFSKATEEYSRAVGMDPNRADAWYRLWELYSASGKNEKAKEAYAHAHRLDPERFPEME